MNNEVEQYFHRWDYLHHAHKIMCVRNSLGKHTYFRLIKAALLEIKARWRNNIKEFVRELKNKSMNTLLSSYFYLMNVATMLKRLNLHCRVNAHAFDSQPILFSKTINLSVKLLIIKHFNNFQWVNRAST